MANDSIESLLNKATSPLDENSADFIDAFCEKVRSNSEGAIISTRLLAHKIQSPQEIEAMKGLDCLQACVRYCGEIFERELGKFRFLNELIKVVSPKYLGKHSSEKVQKRIVKMLYTWSCHFRNQNKIRDAYQMLKKQGVVTTDPSFDNSLIMHVPPPRDERNSIFNDEEKKQQLQKLLKSQKPEDLKAANRLIKSVVQAEEAKMEKMKKRNEVLEETQNNVTLLEEMLSCFQTNPTSTEAMQTMKELYESCVKLRPTLFRLASDTDDSETALMDILRANDDVSRIIQTFEKMVSPHLNSIAQKTDTPASSSEIPIADNIINDLQLLSLTSDNDTSLLTSFSNTISPTKPTNSLLDSDDLLMQPTKSVDVLSFSDILPTQPTTSKAKKQATFSDIEQLSSDIIEMSLGRKPEKKFQPTNVKRSLKELQEENKQKKIQTNVALQQQQQATTTRILAGEPPTNAATMVLTDVVKPATGLSNLLLLGNAANTSNASLLNSNTTDIWKTKADEAKEVEVFSLDDVYVSLDSIRPSTISPLIVYDEDNVRVLIHFAKDHASPIRTDTLVAVVSIMSTNTQILTDISFQAAAPKVMRLKLQTPSSTQLSAYNPIITSAPITQVLIISNPAFKEVKIRYKLEYKTSLDPQLKTYSGIITGFPPIQNWGKL